MNRPLYRLLHRLTALLCALALLSGCGSSAAPDYSGTVTVAVLDCAHVTVENAVQTVARGGDAVFTLTPDVGYSVTSADYENCELEETGTNEVILTLHEVSSALRVTITAEKAEAVLRYEANDGTVSDAETDYYYETYSLTYRKRANTALGTDRLSRDGYTLVGWNTEADGSGERIGLGSRVTVSEDGTLTLYAMWEQWTDAADFTWVNRGINIAITGYTGSADKVVLPAELDGLPVVSVQSGAFAGTSCTEVVLPVSLTTIEAGAFSDCALRTLTMFDNVTDVSDESFPNCADFSTLRINAARLPCYVSRSRHAQYADKVDLLILAAEEDRPRMVFFAGSSMWFSLEGEQAEEAFDGAYTIVNLGLSGFYSGAAQLEVIESLLREGDVFVHAPEVCSSYQLLTRNDMTENMFTCFELNYDLFSLVDLRNLEDVFDAWASFNASRADLEQYEYDSWEESRWVDEYGCIPYTRPQTGGDEDLLDDASIDASLLTEDAFARLNRYYDAITEITGNPVCFAFGPVNYDGLPEEQRTEAVWDAFEETVRANLTDSAVVISHLSDTVYRGHLFYYTDFHLNSEGSVLYTALLTEGIAAALEGAEP